MVFSCILNQNNCFSETFSKNLAELLKNNNINQKELAKKIGVSPSTVSMWVTGNSSPRMDLLEKIAEVFNIAPSVLLTDLSLDSSQNYIIHAALHSKHKSNIIYQLGKAEIDFLSKKGELFNNFMSLNRDGQTKLYDYSCDLLEIPKYRADSAPDQGNTAAPDELMAAHRRTDIESTKEGIQHDLDIMNNPSTRE